jgi:hypothetical protein
MVSLDAASCRSAGMRASYLLMIHVYIAVPTIQVLTLVGYFFVPRRLCSVDNRPRKHGSYFLSRPGPVQPLVSTRSQPKVDPLSTIDQGTGYPCKIHIHLGYTRIQHVPRFIFLPGHGEVGQTSRRVSSSDREYSCSLPCLRLLLLSRRYSFRTDRICTT